MKINFIQNQNYKKQPKSSNTSFKGFGSVSYAIQSNTVLNRAVLNTLGWTIPFAIKSNSKEERFERVLSSCLYMAVAFGSPKVMLPLINKHVLKNAKVVNNTKGKAFEIMRVSKEYLTKELVEANGVVNPKRVKAFKEAIRQTAVDVEKEYPKIKGIKDEYEKILTTHKDDLEGLRQKLVKAHKNAFKLDFLTTSVAITTIPWVMNAYTAIRTGRKGYSGEFDIANQEYIDKQTEKHEKNKKAKTTLSYGLAVLPALIIPRYFGKAMMKSPEKLSGLKKQLNKNAKSFNYKDGKYMSMATYAIMWTTGDFPSYLLACRDKHELKYKSIVYTVTGAFFFLGDAILNSVIGQGVEKIFKNKGIKIMKREGLENKSQLRKLFMPMESLGKLKADTTKAGIRSFKTALGMYWVNLGISALVLGFTLPSLLNKVLKQDVHEDIANESKQNFASSFYKNIAPKEVKELFKAFN